MARNTRQFVCRICGIKNLRIGSGRPRIYCSAGCKALRDREIKRLERRIDSLKEQQDELELELRYGAAIQIMDPDDRTAEERMADIVAKLAETQARFLELFADDDCV